MNDYKLIKDYVPWHYSEIHTYWTSPGMAFLTLDQDFHWLGSYAKLHEKSVDLLIRLTVYDYDRITSYVSS